MPIFEYKCRACEADFELLVMASTVVACSECGSKDVKKKFSTFGMSGVDKPFAGTSGASCSSCSKSTCSSCS